MSTQPDYARIPLKPSTRDDLRAAKSGGETYDDVVTRLLAELKTGESGVSRVSDAEE